jgi:hypothetical protein
MKLFLVVFFSFITASFLVAGLPKDIELEAGSINYYKNNRLLVATDNVVLTYKEYDAYSDHFEYDSELQKVRFPNYVLFKSDEQHISVNAFEYDLLLQKAVGKELDSKVKQLYMKADRVYLEPERIILYDANFSTCSEQDKHFYLQSKKIEVYSDKGYFLAKKNKYYFKYLPFAIPVPSYVYGAKQNSVVGASTLLPDLGGNAIEGTYARYVASYFVNEQFSGAAKFGYSEKLKWNIGGANVFNLSDNTYVGARYAFYFDDHILSSYLVMSRRYYLGNSRQVKKELNLFDQIATRFSQTDNRASVELRAEYQKNEILNNYWVSYKPKMMLGVDNLSINERMQVKGEVSYASISESRDEYSYSDNGLKLLGEFKYQYPVNTSTNLEYKLSAFLFGYDKTSHWNRLFNTVSLSFNVFLNPKIGYSKQVFNDGESPFRHERDFVMMYDEMELSVSQQFKRFRFSQEAFYTFETEKFRRLDYTAEWLFHCWGIGFRWQTQQDIFSLTFSLL